MLRSAHPTGCGADNRLCRRAAHPAGGLGNRRAGFEDQPFVQSHGIARCNKYAGARACKRQFASFNR